MNRREKVILLGSCRTVKEAGPITEILKVRKDWLFHSVSASGLLGFKHFQIVIQDCNWANTALKFAIMKTQTHSKTHIHIKRSHKFEVFWSENAKCWVTIFKKIILYNHALCFKVGRIVVKFTIRNYDTPSKWVIEKRIKTEVIQKDFLTFWSGVIIVNYKYQGNILLGLLNLLLRKRKWWGFSPIIDRCRVWKLKNIGFFYFQWKCLDILKTNQINISCRVSWVFKKITI